MKQQKIEGIALISENGTFSFNSGLPADEPVLEFDLKACRGSINFKKNACVDFVPSASPAFIPPAMDLLLREGGMTLKRTSRNYIVTMKFPIIESSDETKQRHSDEWKKAMAQIKRDRETIKEIF
ncbi:MAG: hypothetical protein MJ001_02250 [Paludibacteraceae bacterium]|nr:hypothetical protein [Paludibacteraceae bacterium]